MITITYFELLLYLMIAGAVGMCVTAILVANADLEKRMNDDGTEH